VCYAPLNGYIDCGSGLTGSGFVGDMCSFLCNLGYRLQQSVISGICLNTGNWSGGPPFCVPHNCTTAPLPDGTTVISSPSCSLVYQSQCTLSCDEGFTGNDVTYLCNVTSDPTMVDWVPIGGVNVMCERG